MYHFGTHSYSSDVGDGHQKVAADPLKIHSCSSLREVATTPTTQWIVSNTSIVIIWYSDSQRVALHYREGCAHLQVAPCDRESSTVGCTSVSSSAGRQRAKTAGRGLGPVYGCKQAKAVVTWCTVTTWMWTAHFGKCVLLV
jgi:hypothetical protein